MSDFQSQDAAWRCFRYLSAEMSPDEIVDFEQALADDQSLREALATEVELVQAVAAAESARSVALSESSISAGNSRSSSRSWAGPVRWIALGAALSLGLVLLWQAGHWQRDALTPEVADRSPAPTASDAASRQLALVWSETREEMAASELLVWDELPRSEATETSMHRLTDTELPVTDDAADLDAADLIGSSPAWMLAALASMRQAEPMTESPQTVPDESPVESQP